MKNLTQPLLRFQEFEDAWLTTKLSNVCTFHDSERIPISTEERITRKGEYPYYGASGVIDYVDNYIFDGEFVLLGEDGANILSRTTRLAFIAKGKFWVNNHAHVLKATGSNYFLAECLETINYEVYNTGTVQPKLNSSICKSILVSIPSIKEQQKIASFLTLVDEKITKLKEKKKLLEQYKKTVVQQLFSQELRFKDENGEDFPDWEELQLSEVLFEHKTKNKDNKTNEVFSVAKHKGVINQIEHLGRSYSAKEISHYKVILPGDIVYTKSPTSDFPFGIIKQNRTSRSGVVSPLYGVFTPDTESLGFILHEYFLSPINTSNYLSPLVQKGAKNTMNINNDAFLNGAQISLPVSEKEQKKIADFISIINEKIQLTTNQIIELEIWKKGLLQQMFV